MLLHVIWGLVDGTAHECPTFSVTGVMLQCDCPTQVRQSRFRWCDDAWEADVEVSRIGTSSPLVSGIIRLSPTVWAAWTSKSLNPRSEASRQIREVLLRREWTDLGIIILR
jgi:hypothetical protein